MNWDSRGALHYISAGGLAALGLLLLAAGRLLVRRRLRPAAIVHLVWAGLMIAAVFGLPLTWLAGDDAWLGPGAFLVYVVASLGSWIFQSLLYPVFVLVWFLRPRTRRQIRAA